MKNNTQAVLNTNPNTVATSSPNKPIFCLVGGGFAVGKSTLAKRLKETDLPRAVIVDTEEFIIGIPEFADLRATDPNDAVRRVYPEALDSSNRVLAKALAQRQDIIWPVIGDGSALRDAMEWVKDMGYYLRIEFVDCPFEEAMDRAVRRSEDSNDLLHFGRHPKGAGFWLQPAFPEPEDVARIQTLYAEHRSRGI